jgi:hypothetical protein
MAMLPSRARGTFGSLICVLFPQATAGIEGETAPTTMDISAAARPEEKRRTRIYQIMKSVG